MKARVHRVDRQASRRPGLGRVLRLLEFSAQVWQNEMQPLYLALPFVILEIC